jgi:hypothetical protein
MKNKLMLILIFIVGCNGGGGGSSISTGGVKLTSHYGIWATCSNDDEDSDGINDVSFLKVMTVAAGSVALSETTYSDVDCNGGDELFRYSNTDTYSRSGNVYTYNLKTLTYVSLAASDVTWNNSNEWCGITNWVLNVPRNMLGKNCGDNTYYSGDVDTMSIVRNGNKLTIDGINLDLYVGTDFTPAGLTLPNGSFSFSNGENAAMFAIFNSGSYQLTSYDLVSRKYMVEYGTYTSSNNVVHFTVTQTNPANCLSDSETLRFTSSSYGVTIESSGSDFFIFAEKVSYSESNFRSEILGGGLNLGCIE